MKIVSARILGKPGCGKKEAAFERGVAVKKDILNHLKEDTNCLATTMVDYYGLPQTGDRAWPGRAEAGTLPFADKSSMC